MKLNLHFHFVENTSEAQFSFDNLSGALSTIKILSIGSNRPEKTVRTQIRLLFPEQSDLGLCCMPFYMHLLEALLNCSIL